MSKVILYITFLVAVFACDNAGQPARTVEREPNVVTEYPVPKSGGVTSTRLNGTYRGTLPCADCGGIEVTLRLHGDNNYVLKTRHISDKDGGKDIEAEYDGKYSWDESRGIVTLHGITNQPDKYLYVDGTLVQLDINGNRINGPLAEKYILRR